MHAVRPKELPNLPLSHSEQSDDEPTTALYLPKAHKVQLARAVAAGEDRKVPAGQLTQENGEFWP